MAEETKKAKSDATLWFKKLPEPWWTTKKAFRAALQAVLIKVGLRVQQEEQVTLVARKRSIGKMNQG